MGWGESQDAYNQVQSDDFNNQASFSHELIGGAAAFAGFKAFEDHQRKEGKTVNHAFAKELLAGFAGAEADRLAETKGEDAWDRHKAKEEAQNQASDMYDQHYGGQDQYDPNQAPHDSIQQQFGGY